MADLDTLPLTDVCLEFETVPDVALLDIVMFIFMIARSKRTTDRAKGEPTVPPGVHVLGPGFPTIITTITQLDGILESSRLLCAGFQYDAPVQLPHLLLTSLFSDVDDIC